MRKLFLCILALLFLVGCTSNSGDNASSNSASGTNTENIGYSSTTAISREIAMESEDWESENPIYIDLDDPVDAYGVAVSQDQILISLGRTYVLSGTTQRQIRVNSTQDADVRLVLNGASLTGNQDAAIYVESVKDCIITLAEGSSNYIEDTESYVSDTEATAAIYSKDDLKINGSGSLEIIANYNNAIQSKDDLFILNGTLAITAKDKGFVGKDSVRIAGGTISIVSGKDAIQSTNTEENGRGYVLIIGGDIDIVSSQDGIQAATECLITGGALTIYTGEGSASAVHTNEMAFGRYQTEAVSEDDVSLKGIKAEVDLSIEGGVITIDSEDDSLHSNGTLTIAGGVLELSSGDDGAHADSVLSVSGGQLNILTSYEGLEGSDVVISGGTIDLYSSDDGINAAGGKDESGMMSFGRFTKDSFDAGDHSIVISGGKLNINADGDGIDSNGSIAISGGTTVIMGPSDGANGSIDYAAECIITGGTLLAVGSSGMLQVPSSSSTQYTISSISADGTAGNQIEIVDSSGNVLFTVSAFKRFNAVLFSDAALAEQESYTIKIDGNDLETIIVDSIVSGSTQGMMGGFDGSSRMEGRFEKGAGERELEGEPMQDFPKRDGEVPEGMEKDGMERPLDRQGAPEDMPPSFEKGEIPADMAMPEDMMKGEDGNRQGNE